MNVVTLIGNLATDVELKELPPDRRVATFILAVERQPPGGRSDVVRVAAWNRQAELCHEHLTRGSRIGVDGRLRSRSWEDAEGRRRTAVEVVADRVQFLSPPPGRTNEPQHVLEPVG